MPEGVGYGPQFTASVGKTLNYVGKFVYAYSGNVGVTNSETVLLETATGSHVIKGKIQMSYDANASDNYHYKIYFNDVEVFGYLVGHGSAEGSED